VPLDEKPAKTQPILLGGGGFREGEGVREGEILGIRRLEGEVSSPAHQINSGVKKRRS